MNASGACLSLIKRSESCTLTAKWDVNGWEVGWGHHGPDVKEGMVITQAWADWLLRQDVKRFELQVMDALKTHPCTPGQFDAFISFVYEMGIGALEGSTLWKKFLAGDLAGAAAEFPKWDHMTVGKQEVENEKILERRKAEQRFFLGTVA